MFTVVRLSDLMRSAIAMFLRVDDDEGDPSPLRNGIRGMNG